MIKRICPICMAEFETTKPNKKYCSFTCKEAGRLMLRAKWKAANPTYDRDYARMRAAQNEKAN